MKPETRPVDPLEVTTTSYLHRPTVELTRLSSKKPGRNAPASRRWAKIFGLRDEQCLHRVSQVNLGSLTIEIQSAERFRVGERVSISNGEMQSIATVESIQHNDLSKEQSYRLRVEPSTLEHLSEAWSHAPIALVDRRNESRSMTGMTGAEPMGSHRSSDGAPHAA